MARKRRHSLRKHCLPLMIARFHTVRSSFSIENVFHRWLLRGEILITSHATRTANFASVGHRRWRNSESFWREDGVTVRTFGAKKVFHFCSSFAYNSWPWDSRTAPSMKPNSTSFELDSYSIFNSEYVRALSCDKQWNGIDWERINNPWKRLTSEAANFYCVDVN